MKKKFLTIGLSSLLALGSITFASLKVNAREKFDLIENVDAGDDEEFLNAKANFLNSFDPVDTQGVEPQIGIQTVLNTENNTYSVRFIAAINLVVDGTAGLTEDNLAATSAIWYREMFYGSGETRGDPVKPFATKPSNTVYTKLNVAGSVYSIEDFNTEHNSNYDCFVTYALKNIPQSYANDYLVVGFEIKDSDFNTSEYQAKNIATKINGTTQFAFANYLSGASLIVKKANNEFDKVKVDNIGDNGFGDDFAYSRYETNFLNPNEQVLVASSDFYAGDGGSNSYFLVYGYQDDFASLGCSRVGDSDFIQLPGEDELNFMFRLPCEKVDRRPKSMTTIEAKCKTVAAVLNDDWAATQPGYRMVTLLTTDNNNGQDNRFWAVYTIPMSNIFGQTWMGRIMVPASYKQNKIQLGILDSQGFEVDSHLTTNTATSYLDFSNTSRGVYYSFDGTTGVSGSWNPLVLLEYAIEPLEAGYVSIGNAIGIPGEQVQFNATSYSPNTFSKWTDLNNNQLSTSVSYNATIPNAANLNDGVYKIKAVFNLADYNYTVTDDPRTGHYNLGSYPQTHITDNVIISALNSKTEPDIHTDVYDYYGYMGTYYAKAVATDTTNRAVGDIMKFEDGSTIVPGTTYWFRVEPVKWSSINAYNVGGSDERYILVGEKIIDQANWFVDGYTDGVSYSESAIRSKIQSQIEPQMIGLVSGINWWKVEGDKLGIISHSACLKMSEKGLSFGVTDYARAKGVSVWEDGYNGQDYTALAIGNTYMGPGGNMLVKNNGSIIMVNGNGSGTRTMDAGYYGVLPDICLIRSGMEVVPTPNA